MRDMERTSQGECPADTTGMTLIGGDTIEWRDLQVRYTCDGNTTKNSIRIDDYTSDAREQGGDAIRVELEEERSGVGASDERSPLVVNDVSETGLKELT